jgi:Skp family chaperone for outer membrane proteins|tara:strand:+ start:141 stop:662 length:522 start_codon:yes stop_codon:yes gene_type:complete
MKKYILILSVIVLSITNFSIVRATIVFVDLDKIVLVSKAGKSIIDQLDVLNKATIIDFKETEKILKDKEIKLISQKKILSPSEYEKNIVSLRSEIDVYGKERNLTIKRINKLKIENTQKLLQHVNKVLVKYSEENSISIILQKKYIITGKSDLDVSDDILNLVNKNVKEFKIK